MVHAGDMPVPDFTYYRRSAVKDSAAKSSETFASRVAFTYLTSAGAGVVGAYAATNVV